MTIFDFLDAKKDSTTPLVSWINRGQLEHLNQAEYKEYICKTVSILKRNGLKKGDRICLMATTSLEWHLFDMAIMAIGASTVPIFPTISHHDLLESFKLLKPTAIVTNLDLETDIKRIDCSLENIRNEESNFQLSEITKSLTGSDLACVLMTSGTTGKPKVMEFRHEQLYIMLASIRSRMNSKITSNSKSHTALPLSHVLGRCDSLLHLVLNTTTQYGTGLENLKDDLKITRPHYFITIPYILSKMVNSMKKEVEQANPLKKHLFQLLINSSKSFLRDENPGHYHTMIFLRAQKFFKDILKKQGLGNLKFIVVGGGRVNKDDFNFFEAIGINVLQGYGLTETLGPLTVSDFNDHHYESVGLPFKNVEIAFAEDGEILVKSPYLFDGYLNNNQSHFTSDGFYKSGDIGELNEKSQLKITDRKKDIVITAQGVHLSPQKIESLFQGCNFIEKIVVLGDHHPYLCALVSTHKTRLSELIDLGIVSPNITAKEIPHDKAVIKAIQKEIDEINKILSEPEKIKEFIILPIRLEPEGDFMTPSLKIKRTLLYNKFKKEIDAMYHKH
ncbi:MAG: AMP-binding protein [Bdellovibrionota bacterium]|nr:AMP-binding protein [Bdellovibrionota bacterium]